MRIRVITHVRSKRPGVRHLTGSVYEVAVAAIPVKGAANSAVIAAVAKYFKLRPSQVHLVSGHTTAHKTLELLDLNPPG